MNEQTDFIRRSIIRDMSEGVMTVGLNGVISYVNPAAAEILQRPVEELQGQPFAGCFFEYEENDAFTQALLDAVYDRSGPHRSIVSYYTGSAYRQLNLTTSYLQDGEKRIGIIAVLNDITELAELRDAVRAMERIQTLNSQLELRNQLLSETFGRFLSDAIVRQLLDTPDGLALGGVKKELTVMMSDLRGFTALGERMAAQDLITMLNHYLGEMTELIQKHGGTIIEFIGDGIMAIFGAPVPDEKHAEHAVAAAVEMQAAMERVNAWNARRGFPKLEMGIGVNTGEMIVGNIGSEKRTKYGVTGSEVNLCGRIESYTVGGQLLIDPVTRSRITVPLTVAETRRVQPKGVKEPIELSLVTGIGGAYGLSCVTSRVPPTVLNEPAPVAFFVVREKHTSEKALRGEFTALSVDGAQLHTEEILEDYENLQFEFFGQLFGKVLAGADGAYTVRFTARPEGFAAALEERYPELIRQNRL